MELLVVLFCLWVIIAIKSAKARIALLENSVSKLNSKINELSKIPDNPVNNIVDEPVTTEFIEETPENPSPIINQTISQPVDDHFASRAGIATAVSADSIIKDIPSSDPPIETPPYTEMYLPEWVMRSLTGGRLFVTLGLFLLFIGLTMLFKYTAQYIVISIELRFISVALGAFAMMYFGHRQINTRRDYGLYLNGGGLGILFLTIFVAFKFYALLSPGVAFILLAITGLSTFALAVKYDTMALAVLAITGGFLSPILTSTGHGSHIGLFSYYLLLNLVIFAIAWLKSWRVLNNIGFAFTFIIGLAWGGRYYIPEFYPSVQGFLIAYFLLYVGIGILFASRDKPDISIPVDAASIFGVPLIGFSLQLALTKYFPNGHTVSCLALGAFYIILAGLLRRSARDGWKLLSEIFTWLSALFFTLAIPFAFSAQTTAPLWAMEGAAMLWMMNRRKQKLYGYAGVLLLAFSNVFILATLKMQNIGTPFANGFFISTIILAIAHFIAAYFLHPKRSSLNDTENLANIASFVGMLWWFGAGGREIIAYWLYDNTLVALLIFYALSAFSAMMIHIKSEIALFDKPVALVLPAIIAFSALNIAVTRHNYHPFMDYGFFAYVIAFAVHYYWLLKNNGQNLAWKHVAAYITLIAICSLELGHYIRLFEPEIAGKISGWLLAILAGIILLILPERYQKWPLTILCKQHQYRAGLPLVILACILCVASFSRITLLSGHYIPLLNLVDITEILTVITFMLVYRYANVEKNIKTDLLTINIILVFLLVNALILRSISSYIGFGYLSREMFASVIVQTSLTILWTLISMATMLISSKRAYRNGWFVGVALLAVVVLKLFFIDLAGVGTISRIISFIGVGMLTISLGFYSPIPPKKEV